MLGEARQCWSFNHESDEVLSFRTRLYRVRNLLCRRVEKSRFLSSFEMTVVIDFCVVPSTRKRLPSAPASFAFYPTKKKCSKRSASLSCFSFLRSSPA